jgi:putative tricarboxylic transport membrane protein
MIASMWIGNLMLLIINLPLIGLWVKLLQVPYRLLFPSILMFCCIGIYSINSQPIDVMFIAFFGIIGYCLLKFGFEPAPMLLGFVLGRLMEENLRRALIIARGDGTTFLTRTIDTTFFGQPVGIPLSGILLGIAVTLLVIALLPSVRKGRDEVFTE